MDMSYYVPRGMYTAYDAEKKRFVQSSHILVQSDTILCSYRKISKAHQRSLLLRLPPEVQMCIGHWVSCLGNANEQSRAGLSLFSSEIYNFRLVCKKLASIGASIIALHAKNVPRSAYKSVAFDFTDHALQVLESISKRHEISTSISTVYFILWRFDATSLSRAMTPTAYQGAYRAHDIDFMRRWQQRQHFFQCDGLLYLSTVLKEFPNLTNWKWVEKDCSPIVFDRRPHKYDLFSVSLPTRPIEDSFTRMFEESLALEFRTDTLREIFSSLTHLHLEGTIGAVTWDESHIFWERLTGNMPSLTCLKLEGDKNSVLINRILDYAELPNLKKLILKHLHSSRHVIGRKLIARFLRKHAASLRVVKISYLHLSDPELCLLLVQMRRTVSDAEVSVLYHSHHNLLSHAAIDGHMRTFLCFAEEGSINGVYDIDYGHCVMKNSLPTSLYDGKSSTSASATIVDEAEALVHSLDEEGSDDSSFIHLHSDEALEMTDIGEYSTSDSAGMSEE